MRMLPAGPARLRRLAIRAALLALVFALSAVTGRMVPLKVLSALVLGASAIWAFARARTLDSKAPKPANPHRFLPDSEVERRLEADPGFNWAGQVGGGCPVMVEFELDGFPGVFRSRWSHWWFIVGTKDAVDPLNNESEQLVQLCTYYGEPGSAGYIPLEQAFLFVEQGIDLFRKLRQLSGPEFANKAAHSPTDAGA